MTTPEKTPENMHDRPRLDHHDGDPITTLDDVRDRYNVVAAVPSVGTARRLIGRLEDADIDPSRVSLLGAWPQQQTPPPPQRVINDTARAAGWGAIAGMAAISLFAHGWRRRITVFGGILTGLATALVAAATVPGSSRAWRHTLVADGDGTVAVGVHSKDPLEVVSGEKVMREHDLLAVNRF